MQMTTSLLSKRVLLASAAFIALLASQPSFAKDDATAGDHPVSLAPSDDAAAPAAAAVPASSLSPETAMANPTATNDPLSAFGPSSGTVVGNRAVELRDEVVRLRASVNLDTNQFSVLRANGAAGSVQYHSTVAAIQARLQNGTTRGNPILLRQWQEASASLDEATSSLDKLNALLTAVNSDTSVGSYLQQSIQAGFSLSGAVDEDHDQLKILHDEVSHLMVQLEYLRTQTTADIQRDTNYLTSERGNLQTLAFDINRGEIISDAPPAPILNPAAAPVSQLPPHADAAPVTPVTQASLADQLGIPAPADTYAGAMPTAGRLLVLIRYNQPVVNYEQQLSQAVGTVVERQPDAKFSVVAVSPAVGDPADVAKSAADAERNAESVKRSLIQLGLPVSSISTANTQTQSAQVPEVHVYVR